MSREIRQGDWLIHLRPTAGHPNDPGRRVAGLLKTAKRTWGLECVQLLQDIPSPMRPVEPELDAQRSEPPFAAPPAVASERKRPKTEDKPP